MGFGEVGSRPSVARFKQALLKEKWTRMSAFR